LTEIQRIKENLILYILANPNSEGGRRGRDHMVVGFTTTYKISVYHHWCCELESQPGRGVQYYVIKFVSDLRQVGGFLQVLRFPPPIKLHRDRQIYSWMIRTDKPQVTELHKQIKHPITISWPRWPL